MVAQKRGRGAKAQPAKAKPAVEEPVPEAEVAEGAEAADESNGQTEQSEAGAEATPAEAEGTAETAEGAEEPKPEEKKEEKIESGKVLVENLPSSYLFDYQEKLKELFSNHGEVINVKRGPIIVTELTTTPTLSAIVEFKNKDSVEKALLEDGALLDGSPISVAAEARSDTTVLAGVPYEASTDYVRLLFAQCGPVAHIHEFSKAKFKILRVTFTEAASATRALQLDRELRINGFLVTVAKYREDDDKQHQPNSNKNKRQHPQNQNRNNANAGGGAAAAAANNVSAGASNRQNNFRARGGGFNARGNFRGGRGRGGFGGRGGAFPRGGFAPPVNAFMPPQGFMGRPGGFMNDGQRPNKRLRQM